MTPYGLAQWMSLTQSHPKAPVVQRPPAGDTQRRILRRLISIPAVLLLTLLTTALLPALLIIALILQCLPQYRGALRTLAFVLCYLWCETLGILASSAVWLKAIVSGRSRSNTRYLADNYRLQRWWVRTLYQAGIRLYGVRLQVSGQEALHGGAPILMPRHASLADTLLPLVCYAIPQDVRLAYVMKRELLWDPCLDIVGHRVPNFFIDRTAEEGSTEATAMANLLRSLPAHTGLLIYPEGTRYSVERRDRALQFASQSETADLRQRMQNWPDLLPPRLGGPLALLGANPGRDLLFCAHLGFEGASHLRNLFSGRWTHALIQVHFWRVPYAEIPKDNKAQLNFIWSQWDQMQHEIHRLRSLR